MSVGYLRIGITVCLRIEHNRILNTLSFSLVKQMIPLLPLTGNDRAHKCMNVKTFNKGVLLVYKLLLFLARVYVGEKCKYNLENSEY